MKRPVLWLGLSAWVTSLIGSAAWAGPSQVLPTPFPEIRYQQMRDKSPFFVATTGPASAPEANPGFAADLYVDGVAHVGQTDFVAIKSRDPEKRTAIFLQLGSHTADGLTVERVQWSDTMGKSTVDVAKGGEKAILVFDESQLANRSVATQPIQRVRPGEWMPGEPLHRYRFNPNDLQWPISQVRRRSR